MDLSPYYPHRTTPAPSGRASIRPPPKPCAKPQSILKLKFFRQVFGLTPGAPSEGGGRALGGGSFVPGPFDIVVEKTKSFLSRHLFCVRIILTVAGLFWVLWWSFRHFCMGKKVNRNRSLCALCPFITKDSHQHSLGFTAVSSSLLHPLVQ